MLKKIIAASAVLAFLSLFACSSDDDKSPEKGSDLSSSSPGEDQSSSSDGKSSSSSLDILPNTEEVTLALASKKSKFETFFYIYTMIGSNDEDLEQFWTCPAGKSDDKPASSCTNTALQATNAILQNPLTNQYSPLHYNINPFRDDGVEDERLGTGFKVELINYKLVTGSQAALGLNVADPDSVTGYIKNISEIETSVIDPSKAVGFLYRYSGGAHVFRAVVHEGNFWFFRVPAAPVPKNTPVTIKIPFSEFMSAGNLAKPNDEGTPFDLSKVSQFLWVVEHDKDEPENNEGSLTISYFKGLVPK